MCELLALSFNRPVRPSLSFRGFQHRGDYNPHGWGLACYPDKSAHIFKEPVRARASGLAQFLRNYPPLRSRIFIAHVRYMSCGEPCFANTHPFSRELRGEDIVFAHNGTLCGRLVPVPGPYAPIGGTDSERAFCAVLNWITAEQVDLRNFERLHTKLSELNEQGSLNVLFSNGVCLYAYHDARGYKGLHLLRREAPFERVRLNDEDWEGELRGEKGADERGYLIASAPLTDENWRPFEPGSLLVFENGEQIYNSSQLS